MFLDLGIISICGAQPALHYPAGLADRTSKACFAGTWYGDRHQARGNDMQWLLKAALPLGVDIFDRNFNTDNFNFPEEYHPYIKGGLPYEALCNEYRRYRLFLNVNSVTDSPTMFSRRVFELLACGTPIVSAYAQGIEDLFGGDVVEKVTQTPLTLRARVHVHVCVCGACVRVRGCMCALEFWGGVDWSGSRGRYAFIGR